MKDVSRERVCAIAFGGAANCHMVSSVTAMDSEMENLLEWLGDHQQVDQRTALKKALAMAVYFYDLTDNEGCELIAKHPNGAMGKVIL